MRTSGNLCYRALCIELRCRPAGNFRQTRRTVGNANGKQQSDNEASRSHLQQIVRAIISVVTLPSSVTARRKFRLFGFQSLAYSHRSVPRERYLSREIDRSFANSGYLEHLRSHADVFGAQKTRHLGIKFFRRRNCHSSRSRAGSVSRLKVSFFPFGIFE